MDTESVKWFQIMNIFGSSLGTYSLCISLIILETKMLESWCNSLPGKQISEYLGQAAAERWSIWQPAKYALLQLPNKLRISFSNLDYFFLKKISLICFFVYQEEDRLSMVEKLSIKWYFHSDSTHLFSRIHIFSIQWNTSEVLVKNDQDSTEWYNVYVIYFPTVSVSSRSSTSCFVKKRLESLCQGSCPTPSPDQRLLPEKR